MPTDIIHTDDGDTISYFSKAHPSMVHRVSRDKVVSAAFTARDWHGGQWTGLYALGCGAFDYVTIERAFNEACAFLARDRLMPESETETDADAILGLECMIEDLRACLDPRFGEGAKCVRACGRDAADASATCAECGS